MQRKGDISKEIQQRKPARSAVRSELGYPRFVRRSTGQHALNTNGLDTFLDYRI